MSCENRRGAQHPVRFHSREESKQSNLEVRFGLGGGGVLTIRGNEGASRQLVMFFSEICVQVEFMHYILSTTQTGICKTKKEVGEKK